MTCLYCGKKLGFFSRYKDTPFCSEEHLRIHQDELERALIERLGSKAPAPARSLSDLVEDPPAPLKSMLGLENAVRTASPPKPVGSDYKLPEPPPVVEEVPPPAPKPPAEPAPLYEDFLFELPKPRQLIDVSKPLIPPSSFAIIVQADCCTPSLPDHAPQAGFAPSETEFEIETTSLGEAALEAQPPPPAAFEADGFGEPWVEIPNKTNLEVEMDFNLAGDFVPLEYEAENSSLHGTAMGHREVIDPRIRLRYPYAASQVTSSWNTLPSFDEVVRWTEAEEWAPVEPVAPTLLESHQDSKDEPAQVTPMLDVPLTIAALTNFNLESADTEDYGTSFYFAARNISPTDGLNTDCATQGWSASLYKPNGSIQKDFRPRWQTSRSADRVPPVSFPSLFQLGPVLPPRPESVAG